MGLSDGLSVSLLVFTLTKLRLLVCVWHQRRYECKQMDLKRASAGRRCLLRESECVQVCVCVFTFLNGCQNVSVCVLRRYYFVHCVNVRTLWKLFCVLQ